MITIVITYTGLI